MMRFILQFLAISLLLIIWGDMLRSVLNINADIGYTPKVILYMVIWWGTILGLAFSWLVWRKRRDQRQSA